jgi:parallel beta-helix repeat protein
MRQSIHKVVIGSVVAGALVFVSATRLSAAGGEIRHVPRDYPTIQTAVDASEEGDTVLVAPGVYSENVVISKSGLRLVGGDNVVLDGAAVANPGRGIHVNGTAATPLTDVEIRNFEVRNFERGISVFWTTGARVTHNYVHHNTDRTLPLAQGEAYGIGLVRVSSSELSHNVVSHNGWQGIFIGTDNPGNTVHHNRVVENGTQIDVLRQDGTGILVQSDSTQIQHNEILANNGRGIFVTLNRVAPLTGILVAYNRVHDNQRAGVSIGGNATGNTVIHNDARENNPSGLGPCPPCNLNDISTGRNGGNVWAFNHGTFNGTDACAP